MTEHKRKQIRESITYFEEGFKKKEFRKNVNIIHAACLMHCAEMVLHNDDDDIFGSEIKRIAEEVERVSSGTHEDHENIVLGLMLLDGDLSEIVKKVLKNYKFSSKDNKIIYDELISSDHDLVTLTNVLKSKGLLEKIGGATRLANMLDKVPTAANVAYHLDKLLGIE